MIIPALMKCLAHTAAKEQGRYCIHGIYIKRVGENAVEMCSTNGRALVLAKLEEFPKDEFEKQYNGHTKPVDGFGAIFDAPRLLKALNESKRRGALGAKKSTGHLLIEESDAGTNAMSHTIEGDSQSIRKIPGIFPAYNQVIPNYSAEDSVKTAVPVIELERILKTMREGGCRYVTIEVAKETEHKPLKFTARNEEARNVNFTAVLMPSKKD